MTPPHGPVPLPKLIAFHLPQFHSIPENDSWWGEGFTEWTNVRKSRSLYRGHVQPVVPLGRNYYNLTDPMARQWQADLARRYGIHGFCYYHYWFRGKKLLEAILESGQPDFPFCFSWANETWTRRWDGGSNEVLIQQEYGDEPDWKRHFEYLLPFFRDPRYIRHEGKPVFLVYLPKFFREIPRWIDCWDRWARESGLPGIYLVKTLTAQDPVVGDPGFSAFASFEPWLTVWRRRGILMDRKMQIRKRLLHAQKSLRLCHRATPFVFGYDEIWRRMLTRPYAQGEFRGAFVAWDNTPRLGENAKIVHGATPEKFGRYLAPQIAAAAQEGAPFLFINAWNEWAEGAHLEPDERHGHAYLEQVSAALASSYNHLKGAQGLSRFTRNTRRLSNEAESSYHG